MIENRHRLDFADTMRRPVASCLCLALRPYSIGHELALLRARNPLVMSRSLREVIDLPGNNLGDALIEAVDICSQSENEFVESNRLLNVPSWTWRDFRARIKVRHNWDCWKRLVKRCDLKTEAIKFMDYLSAGKTGPEYADMSGEATISIGGPECAILIQYVRSLPERIWRAYGDSELDYPMALARYEFAVIHEQAGKVRLQPDNTQSFADWCDEQEIQLKAGKVQFPNMEAAE